MNAALIGHRIDAVVTAADQLGETPLWCDRTRRLWWLDIEKPKLQSYDPTTGAHEVVALPGVFAGSNVCQPRCGWSDLCRRLTAGGLAYFHPAAAKCSHM